jgi:hypothetical protein
MSCHSRALRLLLFTLLLLVSGCAVKFIYNQLDWLIPWYLDDYVSLNSDQERLFEERLQGYLDWHRKQELPVYADFLEGVAKSAENGLSRDEIDALQLRVKQLSAELFTRLAPALVDSFASLDDEQVTELFTNLAEENQEYVEKFIETSEQEQRQKRAERVQDFIERWTGSLNDGQVRLIQLWSQKYEMMGAEFLQSRIAWQQQLKDTLQRRDEHAYLERSLHQVFSRRGSLRTQEYVKKYEMNEVLLKQLYLQLDKSLSQNQRRRLIEKLEAYAEDFRELSLQPQNPEPLSLPGPD